MTASVKHRYRGSGLKPRRGEDRDGSPDETLRTRISTICRLDVLREPSAKLARSGTRRRLIIETRQQLQYRYPIRLGTRASKSGGVYPQGMLTEFPL